MEQSNYPAGHQLEIDFLNIENHSIKKDISNVGDIYFLPQEIANRQITTTPTPPGMKLNP